MAVLRHQGIFVDAKQDLISKKEEAEMKSSMTLGQKVVTIGGIVGTIVNIKDDNITIQTSIDNSFIEVKNWAIREVEKIETAGKDDKAADEKK